MRRSDDDARDARLTAADEWDDAIHHLARGLALIARAGGEEKRSPQARELAAQFERWFLGQPELKRTAGIPNCLRVGELAKILGLSQRATYQHIRDGKLPALQFDSGGNIRIPIPMLYKLLCGEWTPEGVSGSGIATQHLERRTTRRAQRPATKAR
jgi:excisionase family DNA binding protein